MAQLTKQEERELRETMELTPEEKRLCLLLRIKRVVLPAVENLGYCYSCTATRIHPNNGEYIFEFTSSESPTLELRIKGE